MSMTLSDRGDAMLVAEEGDVLRAYKCPAGVWTIGTGLTANSGVVTPRAGMTITREESARLRRLALARNYEPRVNRALGIVQQHVFDGGVLFDFNTGGILKASWVAHLKAGALNAAEKAFKSWHKGGGRVLAGLVKRRDREWLLIRAGIYSPIAAQADPVRSAAINDLVDLGYAGGPDAVRRFQADHQLTVDGVIGPATRAAIARAKSARAAARGTGAAGAGGAAVGTGIDAPDGLDLVTLAWAAGGALALAGLVLGAWLVWSHRGPLFAWLPEPVKDWCEARGLVLGRRVRA